MDDILRDELNKPTVFKDEEPLQFEYVPDELPEREKELRKLIRTFRDVLEKGAGSTQSSLITGKVGTGKTVLAKKFGEMIKDKQGFDYVHVNCRRYDTAALAMAQIIRNYDENFPKRGYSVEEMLRSLFNLLKVRDKYLFLTLDEIDFLVDKSGPEILYNLSRLFDDSSSDFKNRISIIYISRDTSFKEELDESTKSTLRNNLIDLNQYSKKELISILNQRVNLAFNPGIVSENAVELIADIASEWGDARFAIELLWKAGKKSDSEAEERVTPEHVRWAKAETHPEIREEVLEDLSEHYLFTLLAVSRLLRGTEKAYVTTGEVKEHYKMICEEYGKNARGHTQFWHYIKEMSNLGIIDSEKSGEGERGTTTMISLPDFPAKILEEKIEKYLELN